MKEIVLTPTELKEMIDESNNEIAKGFFGTLFLYRDNLFKIQRELYHYLKINPIIFADSVFNDRYKYTKEDFVNKEQIEYLCSIQNKIKRTDFDKGIIIVNDIIVGTILENHLDYNDLSNIDLSKYNEKYLLYLISDILLSIRELDINKISHLDLAKGYVKKNTQSINILYKDYSTKIIDLSGNYITYNNQYDEEAMYYEYKNLLVILIDKLILANPKYIELREMINKSIITDYYTARRINIVLEKKLS